MWSDRQLQGLTSTVCGDYCVLFLAPQDSWRLFRRLCVVDGQNSHSRAYRPHHQEDGAELFWRPVHARPSSQGDRRCSCNTRLTLVYANSFAFIVYILFLYTFFA